MVQPLVVGTRMDTFHIKAQALRKSQLEPSSALWVFEPRADQSEGLPDEARRSGKAGWRQSDVKRLIAAAQQAELASYRIEIAPDGTLSVVVGCPADTADNPAAQGDALSR